MLAGKMVFLWHQASDPGNKLATKNRIAHIRWRIQINKTLSAKLPIQNCLSQAFKGRVGIIRKSLESPEVTALSELRKPRFDNVLITTLASKKTLEFTVALEQEPEANADRR